MSSTTRYRPTRGLDRPPRDQGQVLVLFAGGLVTLLVIAALAFDVGMMLLERRDQQNAADAAALAGARFVLASESDAEAAARRIADLNGFDDADPSEVVNVFIPPIHGRYAGLPGFIEVQIEGTRPSIFGGVIGRAAWPVGAYAVATNKQNLTFTFSMLALDPTACKAIQVAGTGEVIAAGSIQSNSSGEECTPPISFSRTGGSTITVGADVYCRAVGPIQDQGSGSMGACIPAANSFALPDPLRNLAAPVKPAVAAAVARVGHSLAIPKGCPGSSAPASEASPATCGPGAGTPKSTYRGKAWVLSPGLYPGGIAASNDATVYLLPGIYWVGGGGLDVGGGGSVFTILTEADANADVGLATWGGGVMIYNSLLPAIAGGPINLNSSAATMKLKPLHATSPDPNAIYNNIVIFQDRTLDVAGDDVTLNGSDSVTTVEGMVYVPGGDVKLNGNGGSLTLGQVIANTYKINGDGGTIEVTDDDLYEAIIVAAGLVE